MVITHTFKLKALDKISADGERRAGPVATADTSTLPKF